ncbi:MAG TPA: hypothetical protein VFX85_04400 [Solirubrobacterales bacterium]|nr:hypothetical protein [Solirubrobacterales bacterium]
MKRLLLAIASVASLALFSATAQAAPPTVGSLAAADLQGVSALLKGSVDPGGLATSYRFEYIDQEGFAASGFAGAIESGPAPAGAGSAPHPARAAIAGLRPSTTYRYRLTATNASGSSSAEALFTTTGGFGFRPGEAGFAARAIADGGATATAAGSHPYQLDLRLGFNQGGEFEDQPGVAFPDGDVRDLALQLPAGLLLNPSVVTQCRGLEFAAPRSSPFEESLSGEGCPDKAQVGTVEVATSRGGGETRRFGLFNLEPPPGVAAQLGFAPYGAPVVIDVGLPQRTDGSYALTLRARNIPQTLDVRDLRMSLWGTPWAASHDGERGNCLNEEEPQFPWAKCSVGRPEGANQPLAYLSLPTRCAGPLSFAAAASSWQQPGPATAQAVSRDALGEPASITSCAKLRFAFAATGLLTTEKASSPSGYNFQLVDTDETHLTDPLQPTSPSTRKAVVRLPAGVTVNPSVGAGLGTCSPAQYAAETPYSVPGAGCPDGSQIGDFTVRTQLFAGSFEGTIYLATPDDPTTSSPAAENPFDSVVAVYLVAKLPARGMEVKLPGLIAPDPATGDLVATFDGLPQIPYTRLDVNFRTGQRSFLISPPACGPAVTEIEMNAWASELAPSRSTSPSPVNTGVGAGPCPPPGTPPFAPEAVAGAYNSNVNYYTPYFVHLTRRDTEQEITSYSLVLPRGITGKLAGIPFCPEGAIEAARRNRGAAETAGPSCPGASQVGRTLTGYGVGAALTYAPGRVYLAGPYNGAPLSLVTINSATVGPFDLGTIVIRSAFQVDPRTAQLQIDSRASDPIPHIIDGIPLHLRDVRIYMDRPEFTHNPSGCEPSALVSTLTGSGPTFSNRADDSTATVTKHFQLLNCLTLGFRPKLGMRLRGGSKRADYPSLRATFAARGPRDSNLRRIDVTMPHSLFLAQEHIRQICTRPQFEAERCPAGSVYGKAVAHTPLFDQPLRGSVVLRSSSNKLPDLVANLRSGSIRIVLEGRIGPARQGIRVLFDDVPDAPIDRFTMTLFGGKRGLLVNSADICKAPPLATVRALGQNNVGASFTTKLRGQCGAKKHRQGGGR